MNENARENILEAARDLAQTRGYGGLNFRDLAATVGIKSASVYHHFASKADLGAAVARRYWEVTATRLEKLGTASKDPIKALHKYPEIFRTTLENGNRMCLCSFMSAEFDDLPKQVKLEVQTFTDINVDWLARQLLDAGVETKKKKSEQRAGSIFAAVAGAQLVARSRSDLDLFDSLIAGYRTAGLIP